MGDTTARGSGRAISAGSTGTGTHPPAPAPRRGPGGRAGPLAAAAAAAARAAEAESDVRATTTTARRARGVFLHLRALVPGALEVDVLHRCRHLVDLAAPARHGCCWAPRRWRRGGPLAAGGGGRRRAGPAAAPISLEEQRAKNRLRVSAVFFVDHRRPLNLSSQLQYDPFDS